MVEDTERLESKENGRDDKRIKLDRGYCYIVKEEKPKLSFRLFEELTSNTPGLFVTRTYPNRLREIVRLGNSKVIWLSHTPGKDHYHPSALSSLTNAIFGVLESKGPVLVDGFEYLVIQNGFNQTLQFVENLNEFVMQNGSIVLIPINPRAFEQKELALLERNIRVIEGSLLSGKKNVSTLIAKY